MRGIEMYKRGLNNKILYWELCIPDENTLTCTHGILGNTNKVRIDIIPRSMTDINKEFESRVKAKRKEGYLELQEIHDNAPEFVSLNELVEYLNKYLPRFNSANNGNILPMLCKTLEDGRPFTKNSYNGQWKINGLRCLVGAEESNDLFRSFRLKFQSREGTTWHLPILEEYLYDALKENDDILYLMLKENAYLDGEIYLPGHSVNEINHFVKDPLCEEHKYLQYWCYDIAVENTTYNIRELFLQKLLVNNLIHLDDFATKNNHLNHSRIFNVISSRRIFGYDDAVLFRDRAIELGFEGLVMRNIGAEYQFGSRKVDTMYKFKKIEDGWFTIVDIVPEGKKRQDLAKLVLKNDINDELFECTCNLPQNAQRMLLTNANQYLDQEALVEYRERSGVKQVPFHAKAIKLRTNNGVAGI